MKTTAGISIVRIPDYVFGQTTTNSVGPNPSKLLAECPSSDTIEPQIESILFLKLLLGDAGYA